MTSIITRLLAIMLGVSTIAFASQSPNPSNVSKDAQKKQASTQPNQTTTPLHVTVTSPPRDPKELEEDRKQRQRELDIQESISTFTKVLALVGFLQAVATIFGLVWTRTAANAAKDAATTARDALHLAERAEVLIDSIGLSTGDGNVMTRDTVISVNVKNFGRTRAKNLQFEGFVSVPNADGAEESTHKQMPKTVLPQGARTSFLFDPLGDKLTNETIRKIREENVHLSVLGTTRYTDTFNHEHKLTFEARWRAKERCFETVAHDAD